MAKRKFDDSQKADAFINIEIVGADGKARKLAGVALREDTKMGRSILNKLKADPEWKPTLQVRDIYVVADHEDDEDIAFA